jgi:hypothetical protein
MLVVSETPWVCQLQAQIWPWMPFNLPQRAVSCLSLCCECAGDTGCSVMLATGCNHDLVCVFVPSLYPARVSAARVRDAQGMPTTCANLALDAVWPATAGCIQLVSLLLVCW